MKHFPEVLVATAALAMATAAPLPTDYLDDREQISPESWLECIYDSTEGTDTALMLADMMEIWTTDLGIYTEDGSTCKSWLSDPNDEVSKCIRTGECYRVEHVREKLTEAGRWPR